jgi:2,3-bisphosphoglycerate-dependent phosphoglycerate mutase
MHNGVYLHYVKNSKMKLFFPLLFTFLLGSCSQTFYVVRHAEKAAAPAGNMMGTDVPLSEAGKQRAERLKELLKDKKVGLIYSTNTIRTKATAQPTADYFNIPIAIYNARPDSAFIHLLMAQKKNTLVVGHSNTVDDIVNMLCNEIKIPGDLNDPDYDNLFVIKRKGKKFIFHNDKF